MSRKAYRRRAEQRGKNRVLNRSARATKVAKAPRVRKARKIRLSESQKQKLREETAKKLRKLAAKLKAPATKVTILRGPKQVESSWVDEIAYVHYGRRNGVAVKFLNGFEAFYQNTTTKDYEYLRDAGSKGKAIWRRFYELPYVQLN